MVGLFAGVLIVRIQLLPGEVQSMGPLDIPRSEDIVILIITVIVLFEPAVVQARSDHESNVVDVHRVGDCMLCQPSLFLDLPDQGVYLIQVDYTVVDALLV